MSAIHKNLFYYIVVILTVFLVVKFFVTPVYHFPDGVGYFSYLASLWFDKDLDFSNEFIRLKMSLPHAITKTGYVTNLWPFGTSILLTPFYLIGELFISSNDSCNPTLLAFTNIGSTFYGILTCFLIYQVLKFLKVSYINRIIASIVTFLGTPLFFYSCILPNSPHAISGFTVSLLFTAWILSFAHYKRNSRWILLGLISGIIAQIRTNEILFAVVVFFEICYRTFLDRGNFWMYIKFATLFSIATIIAFIPQLLIWYLLYGSFSSPQIFNLSLQNFALKEVLFSQYHGILFWTPIIFIAVIGLVINLKKNYIIYFPSLVNLILQILVVSFLTAWWGGYSFGIRYFINCSVIVGLGTGLFLEFLGSRKNVISYISKGIVILVSLWTFILAIAANSNLISLTEPLLPFTKLFDLKSIFFSHKHFIISLFNKNFEYPVFLFFFTGIGFVFFIQWIFRNIKNAKLGVLNGIFLFTTIIFSYQILSSHFNRPHQYSHEYVKLSITKSDLNNIFLLFDLKERVNYYSLLDDKKKVQQTFQRIKNIKMESQSAQNIYEKIVSTLVLPY